MLKRIRRLLFLIFILLSMLVGFWIYAENTNPVVLTLFGFTLEQHPLGLLVVATFVAGTVTGLFCNLLLTSWMVFKIKRLQKHLQKFENKGSETKL